MLCTHCFCARFNQGEGQEENAIVTSTGKYVIAWDFKKVKKGQLDKYEIKKYEDNVVQDNFKFGDDKEIVSEPVSVTQVVVLKDGPDCCFGEQRVGDQQEKSEKAN